MNSRLASVLAVCTAVLLAASVAPSASGATPLTHRTRAAAVTGPGDWFAYHRSGSRDGSSQTMPRITALSVTHAPVLDAKVYASPLVVGGITIVATENNTLYAFGPTYNLLWRTHLGSPARRTELPCGNIDPLGITGTPMYGARYNVVYVAAELGAPPRHQLFGVNFANGTVRFTRTLDLPGVETAAMQQRGALTIAGARVWVPFGGLAGDCGGYKGRLVGYYQYGGGSPVSFTVPTAREAGIWTPPGPTLDRFGQLYVAVGNGAAGPGDPYDLSDSVLKLSAEGKLRGSFAPSTWASDNAADLDLGSLGPTLLSSEKWVFAVGKSGTAYVLLRTVLGGIGGEVSRLGLCSAYGGTASVGATVYVPCTDGLRAVRVDSAGRISVLWHAAANIVGSPVVGGGRVWSLDPSSGVLYSLDPVTGQVRAQVSVGATSRFATPAIYQRNIIVPTITGITVVATS